MKENLEIIFAAVIVLGAFVNLVGAIGVIRLPDIYTRNHAASKGATLGTLLILTAAFLFFWVEDGHMNARLVLGIIFVFVTAPVAGHLISRAAYNSGVPLWEKSGQDALKAKKQKAQSK
ncbi:monovalent cation/H(+) antiporter subunit G [Bacillus sp. PS06]|uniref:monovalent cation/H(+) antiporter subunit G n=1 Tax=Bacillus sp. PS06 TaxID=2764176 RepID=UPI00177FB9C3|nr:monovalent cation/H(+) antiporter subunit G [Bacillus sp. PS06]MBD8070486.1 Na+/H+ antiporter subunit G [Bacillus sp. PS06]